MKIAACAGKNTALNSARPEPPIFPFFPCRVSATARLYSGPAFMDLPPKLPMNVKKRPSAVYLAFACASLAAVAPVMGQSAQAESSPAAKQGQREVEHVRPQVIYNLSSASRETAEALHAQSKAADMSLPIDGNMPISLQLARANANANAAAATGAATQPQQASEQPKSVRPRRAQRAARSSSQSGGGPRADGAGSKAAAAAAAAQGRGHRNN